MVHSLRVATRSALVILVFALSIGVAPQRDVVAQPDFQAQPQPAAARAALDWLRTQQLADGGFAAFGGESDPSATADAVLAFAALNIDPDTVRSSEGVSAIDYLEQAAGGASNNPGVLAKIALAMHAAGQPQPGLIESVFANSFNAETGWYGTSFYGHLLVVIAIEAIGQSPEPAAVDAILSAQTPEGSWGFNGDPTAGTGDSNTTAIAIQALASLNTESDAIANGLTYLQSLQDDTGAVAYDAATLGSSGGDANSTALAMQAFVAADTDPFSAAGGDLLAALLGFQNPSGAFQFQPSFPDDSLLATTQAVPALLLKPLPVQPIEPGSARDIAVQPAQPIDGCVYFEVTQHNVCEPFASYWAANGGLANFGYPLTEVYDDGGLQVQYFERARFERHPENAGTPYEVLLTRVGATEVDRAYSERTAPAEPLADCTYVEVTGHNVCGNMVTFWNAFGGLAVFGYPLTEPFEENGMTVQYFERARLELQPNVWPARYDVLLGRLGAEALERELAR